MKNKKFSIAILLVLCLSFVGMLGVVSVGAKSSNSVHPLEEMPLMDLTHKNFVEKEARASEVEPMGSSSSGQPVDIGDDFTFTVSDDGEGDDYDQVFVVVRDGANIILLVTEEAYAAYILDDVYKFENPIGDDTEPWLRSEDIITDELLDYMVVQFDTNIYPTMEEIFGIPDPRPDDGIDPDRNKVWTLIFNIRDDAYYNPLAESYIAGYFSLADNNKYDKNLMHIDTYAWADRTGPDGSRPYLYEGVFAHEYEHMIHADIDDNEPSWVDEGLADMAGFLCGYGHSQSHIAYYMIYHPFTSLIFWGGGLEDYGASYLFQLYLYEQFGGATFTSALVQEEANGIEGIMNTLAVLGYTETFDEIFDAWTIANYIDDTRKAGGKYGYELFDLGSYDSWGYTIEWALGNFWWGPPDEAPFAFPSGWLGDPLPYTAQYYRFNNKRAATATIEGDVLSGPGPHGGENAWYSGVGAWAWRSIYQSFDLTMYDDTDDITLSFYTFYEIEPDWDYGYVEVQYGLGEWTTLMDNEGFTVDTDPHAQENPNVDVGRNPLDYVAAGNWHAFTGFTDDWVQITMDLSDFAGDTIELHFRAWQDGAFANQMMYVDDILITANGDVIISDTAEDMGDWLLTPDYEDGPTWGISDCYEDNNYGVTVIDTKGVPPARYWWDEPVVNHAMTLHSVSTMFADPVTQMGYLEVSATPLKSGRVKVAIVANHADHILPSAYIFGVM